MKSNKTVSGLDLALGLRIPRRCQESKNVAHLFLRTAEEGARLSIESRMPGFSIQSNLAAK